MIPRRLCEYIARYNDLWNEEALGNFSLGCDKRCALCLKKRPIEKVPQTLEERRLVEHILSKENNIIRTWFKHRSKDYRAIFLAPVGNQAYINPDKVIMVVAGISTSAQAVKKFYQEMKRGNPFKDAAVDAVYEGRMYRQIFEWLKRKDFPIKDERIWSGLKSLKDVSSFRKNPYIFFTQRIKDASLGKSKKGSLIFVPENQPYSNSKACFVSQDFNINRPWMRPFLEEIEIFKNKPVLWLLGRSKHYYPRRVFLDGIKKYFSQIVVSIHPMHWTSNKDPRWTVIDC